MASHVIGPFLTADRPLTDDERTVLDESPVWDFQLLESNPPPPASVSWRHDRLFAALAASHPAATWSKQ